MLYRHAINSLLANEDMAVISITCASISLRSGSETAVWFVLTTAKYTSTLLSRLRTK
jgi:hypothetical protein